MQKYLTLTTTFFALLPSPLDRRLMHGEGMLTF